MALSSAIRAGRAFVEISTKDMFSKTLGNIQAKLFKFARVASLAGIALAGIGGVAIGGAVKLLSDFLEKSDSPAAKTLSASVAKASEAFGRLKMAIGEALAPLATKLLDFATPFLESAASMILNWDQTIASIELAWLGFKGRWIGSTESMVATFKASLGTIGEVAKTVWGAVSTTATDTNATIAKDTQATGLTLHKLWVGFQMGAVAVSNMVREAWVIFIGGMKSAWAGYVGYVKTVWNQAALAVVKTYAFIIDGLKAAQGATGIDLGITGGSGDLVKQYEDNQVRIAKETRDNIVSIAKDQAEQLKKIKREELRALVGINNEAKAEAARSFAGDRERMLELEHYAQLKRSKLTPQGGIALPAGLSGIGQTASTFSGAAAGRLGGAGSVANRALKEAQEANKLAKKTNAELVAIKAELTEQGRY